MIGEPSVIHGTLPFATCIENRLRFSVVVSVHENASPVQSSL
jgi:hypothetical protein